MEHEISVKRELNLDVDESDGEPKLEIAEDFVGEKAANNGENEDAVESLLMLGRQAVFGTDSRQRAASVSIPSTFSPSPTTGTASRRHSSGSEILANNKEGVVSYYQRMRERNNEASKRCRLKRRLKAECMENQSSVLNQANRMLKHRMRRLENVSSALKEGVRAIQAGRCACDVTSKLVRQASRKFMDVDPDTGEELTSSALVNRSKASREADAAVTPNMAFASTLASSCSSEDDLPATPTPPPNRNGNQQSRTALDMINDTILKSLATPALPKIQEFGPLNLVKLNKDVQPKSVILVTNSSDNRIDKAVTVIKAECQDIIGQPVDANRADRDETEVSVVESTTNSGCIASRCGSLCCGDLLSLNKLTCYLDLVSRKVAKDDGTSAMEKVIVKSRLKMPFWEADEAPLCICSGHRSIIVHGGDLTTCVMCSKNRVKKFRPPYCYMYTITFRMSLEYYTTTGIILPIGLTVCGLCKEKNLKAVDVSGSRQIAVPEASLPDETMSKSQVSSSTPQKIAPPPSGDVQVTVRKLQQGVAPVSSTNGCVVAPKSNGNIFAKIGNLNEALRAINPRYKPLGFSITSIDSCSPSVLEDAIVATETAVSTLMSVIAPGQEAPLWDAIKPKLDAKFKPRH